MSIYIHNADPRTVNDYLDDMVNELVSHLLGHPASHALNDYCGHCHEEWEVRSMALGIEDVNLYEDYLTRFAPADTDEWSAETKVTRNAAGELELEAIA